MEVMAIFFTKLQRTPAFSIEKWLFGKSFHYSGINKIPQHTGNPKKSLPFPQEPYKCTFFPTNFLIEAMFSQNLLNNSLTISQGREKVTNSTKNKNFHGQNFLMDAHTLFLTFIEALSIGQPYLKGILVRLFAICSRNISSNG